MVEIVNVSVTNEITTVEVTEVQGLPGPSYLEEDEPFPLNGAGGDSYLVYNSSTQEIEIFVNGVKKGSWG
jgi:hypothetical protein